jgi:hypothetical protein
MKPYQNKSLDTKTRTEGIVSPMTGEEKFAQIFPAKSKNNI